MENFDVLSDVYFIGLLAMLSYHHKHVGDPRGVPSSMLDTKPPHKLSEAVARALSPLGGNGVGIICRDFWEDWCFTKDVPFSANEKRCEDIIDSLVRARIAAAVFIDAVDRLEKLVSSDDVYLDTNEKVRACCLQLIRAYDRVFDKNAARPFEEVIKTESELKDDFATLLERASESRTGVTSLQLERKVKKIREELGMDR